MGEIVARESQGYWRVPTREEQADLAEKYGTETLFYCRDRWAIRHYWINRKTGERQRARCNRWECAYCGPRKVNLWRELVKLAEPVLFLTLTKAGKTVAQARRALTTFIQALRRGSKGKGPNHIGARLAYMVEYFAVLERHEDFERNGFHWHILIKGVDHIPYKEVIKPLWISATHYRPGTDEGAENGWIERIRNNKAIGYVTKYLMKALSIGERGKKEVTRERAVLVLGEDGMMHSETETVTEWVTSKAHRICYSRGFFPERVEVLRKRLFAGLAHDESGAGPDSLVEPEEGTIEEGEDQGSSWMLVEREVEGSIDIEEYKRERLAEIASELEEVDQENAEEYEEQRRHVVAQIAKEVREVLGEVYRRLRRKVLLEALEEDRQLSRRVISMWDYQRRCLRFAG